jgi:hypothetical protein
MSVRLEPGLGVSEINVRQSVPAACARVLQFTSEGVQETWSAANSPGVCMLILQEGESGSCGSKVEQ